MHRRILQASLFALSIASVAPTSGSGSAYGANDITVTGARAAGRTVQSSAAPIDVLDATTLQSSGELNLLEGRDRLLPSVNLPAPVQPHLGSLIRAGQLRNLDPAYTLALGNGKRRHTTALVNEDGFPGSVAADLGLTPSGGAPSAGWKCCATAHTAASRWPCATLRCNPVICPIRRFATATARWFGLAPTTACRQTHRPTRPAVGLSRRVHPVRNHFGK